MKRGERICRSYGEGANRKTEDYLIVRRLRHLITAAFAELGPENEKLLWGDEEFAGIWRDRPREVDRLTLANVLGRLGHCANPGALQRKFQKTRSGRLSFVLFIKEIVFTRKS